MSLLCIIILVFPSVSWKLYRDRNGVQHPDYDGVVGVIMIWCVSSLFAAFMRHELYHETSAFTTFLMCFAVSFTGHGLLFTYGFNIIWYRRTIKPIREEYRTYGGRPASSPFLFIVNHLSSSAIPDKWNWWRSLGWAGRLSIYVSLFTAAVLWFVL